MDKSIIYKNLNDLPILKNLLSDNWIKEELEKNKPSTLIWLIKYIEPMLQHLENNLNYVGSDEINQHKEHILEYLKGEVAQVYGIISEIDVWAHLKKNSIFCTYQPKIGGFDKNPDFLIKLDQDDIIVEVAALNEDNNVKDKMTEMLEEFKTKNKLSGHFVVNEVTQNSDCYRMYDLLKGKTKQLRKQFKNILIINTLFTDGFSLRNAIHGYYRIEKDNQQIGYIDGNRREKGFFEQKEIHRRVNLIVGYTKLIDNCSLYFHNNPDTPFTQKEKKLLSKCFLRQIENVMNENDTVEVIK